MQNLENLDVFKILIRKKLLKCPKDPFVRSMLIYNVDNRDVIIRQRNFSWANLSFGASGLNCSLVHKSVALVLNQFLR